MFVLKWQCIHLPSHLINSSRSSSVLCLMCLQVVFEIVHYLERYYSTQASEADHLLGPFGQVAEHSSKRHQRSDPEQPLDSYEQVTQPSSAAWSSTAGSPAQRTPTEQSLDCCVQLRDAHFHQHTVLHDRFICPVHSDWSVSERLFKTCRLHVVLDPLGGSRTMWSLTRTDQFLNWTGQDTHSFQTTSGLQWLAHEHSSFRLTKLWTVQYTHTLQITVLTLQSDWPIYGLHMTHTPFR